MPICHSILAVIALNCVPLSAGAAIWPTGEHYTQTAATHAGSGAVPRVACYRAKDGTDCGIGVSICGAVTLAGHTASGTSHLPGSSIPDHGGVATISGPRQFAVAARCSDMPWTIMTISTEVITTGLAPAANSTTGPRDVRSIVALPEPASLALILVGVLGVTAVRARRARRRKPGPGQNPE
jgi:hypothetical protein